MPRFVCVIAQSSGTPLAHKLSKRGDRFLQPPGPALPIAERPKRSAEIALSPAH